MSMEYVDVAVIGGGPAGMAAAVAAKENGAERVMIIERDRGLGGILQQCIHPGFGLHYFKEELTGPEYAERFIRKVKELGIETKLDTMVLDIDKSRKIHYVNPEEGVGYLEAGAVVLAMGCRERTRGAINIPGTRPAGIFTAGTAQRLINMDGLIPGRKLVILGSGDVGLIMARRFTLEGAEVKAVVEIMPYPNGLARNIMQCLIDFDIPLLLSHTVTRIFGKERVEGVEISQVDENFNPIPGTEEYIECDTLLLSVGLIPENELSEKAGVELDPVTNGPVVDEFRQTSLEGIFAAGNVLQVHDLVDDVSKEAEITGRSAALYAKGELRAREILMKAIPGENVRYVVPQILRRGDGHVEFFMRVTKPMERVKLVIRNSDVSFKRLFARPGEMMKVKLRESHFKRLKGKKEIIFDIVEDDD